MVPQRARRTLSLLNSYEVLVHDTLEIENRFLETNIVFNVDSRVDHVCVRVLSIRRRVDVCSSSAHGLVTTDTGKSPGRNVFLRMKRILEGIEKAIGLNDCDLAGSRYVC